MRRALLVCCMILILTCAFTAPARGEFVNCTPRSSLIQDSFPSTCSTGAYIVKTSSWRVTWPDGWQETVNTNGFGGCFEGRECWPEFHTPYGSFDGTWRQLVINKEPTLDSCQQSGEQFLYEVPHTCAGTSGGGTES
jgi:hypothetical protein